MRFFIELAYNGSPFFGWQIQPSQPSVQESLEYALSLLLKNKITVVGCGRTDTGVHAKQFFAHFDYPESLDCARLTSRLNNFLCKDIVIFSVFSVLDTLHARFDAVERTYRYYVATEKNPFNYLFSYRVYETLNVDLMNNAAGLLIHEEDFTSFSKTHTQVKNNLCNIKAAFWCKYDGQLVFEISANRFLRNMVRSIVGTLLMVGKEKISINDFQDIINQKNRCKAGASVPAHALFLENVRYNVEF